MKDLIVLTQPYGNQYKWFLASRYANIDSGIAPTQASAKEAGNEAAKSLLAKQLPNLMDYETGNWVRPATAEELAESIEAAKTDGGAGVILVDGRKCYVIDA